MRAKVKSVRRKASHLHGSTAGYLSLVDRGANETPFKMIKSAEGAGAMGIKKRKTTEAKSHKKIATGKKSETSPTTTKTVMAKMVFDQEIFEDEAAVRDWIEKAEWDAEGVSITDDGDGSFVARPEGTTDESFTRLAKVDAESEGVEAFVGTMLVKADDDEDDDEDDDDDADADDGDDEDDEEVEEKGYGKKKPMAAKEKAKDDKAKDAEKESAKKADDKPATPAKLSKRAEFIAKAKSSVKKFSGWDAFYAKKSTLSAALEAGMQWDSTPPGFYDVQAAFNGVVTAILGEESMPEGSKEESLKKAAADYADILIGLDQFFDAYIEAGEETVTKAIGDKAEKLSKWAEGYAQFVGGETEAPVKAVKESVKKSDDAAIDHKRIEDLIAKAVEPLTGKIAEVAGVVVKMSERRPTKKAADTTDAGNGVTKETKAEADDEWLRKKQRKGLLGG